MTDDGQLPMPSTDSNLFDIGQQVDEPTEEELKKAIATRTVLYVGLNVLGARKLISVAPPSEPRRSRSQDHLKFECS